MPLQQISELQKRDILKDPTLQSIFEHQHLVSNRRNIAHNENVIIQNMLWVDHINRIDCTGPDKERFVFRMEHPSTITDGYAKGLYESEACAFIVAINDLFWDVNLNNMIQHHLFLMLTDGIQQNVDYNIADYGFVRLYDEYPGDTINYYHMSTIDQAAVVDFQIRTNNYDLSTIQWKLLPKHVRTLNSSPRFNANQLLPKCKEHFLQYFPGHNWVNHVHAASIENDKWRVYCTTHEYHTHTAYTFMVSKWLDIGPNIHGVANKLVFSIGHSVTDLGANPMNEIPETTIDLLHDYITELKLFT